MLVVDDEPVVSRSLGRLLTSHGFDVRTCESGSLALTLLEEADADVVVTDLNMPGLNGLALLAEVKRRWPSARRVLMSALADTLSPEQLAECAPNAVLAKPFDEAVLVAVIAGEER
ncbi:MAG: response regulator [Myxococcota bacterium]